MNKRPPPTTKQHSPRKSAPRVDTIAPAIARLSKLWHLTLWTFPLDLLLLLLPLEWGRQLMTVVRSPSLALLLLSGVGTIALVFRLQVIYGLQKLKLVYQQSPKRFVVLSLVIIGGIAFLLSEASFLENSPLPAFSFKEVFKALVLIGLSVYTLIAQVRNSDQISEQNRNANFLQEIELIYSAGFFCVRGLSLLTALTVVGSDLSLLWYLPVVLSCILVLSDSKPRPRDFMTSCRSCGRATPKVIETTARCSRCKQRD